MDKIGDRIKKIRQNIGLSQIDMSSNMRVNPKTWSRYENNSTFPPKEILEKLSEVYDINLNWLIMGKGEMLIKDSISDTAQSSKQAEDFSNIEDVHSYSQHILSKKYDTITYQTNLFLEDSNYMLDNEEEQNIEIIKILNTELETSKVVKLPDELKNIEDRLAAIVQYSDDMEPAIKKGSIVIFDVAGGFQGDNIYAVRINGLYTIKRILLNINGGYIISNEKSSSFNIKKETSNFIIGGLVRAVLTMI